MPAQAWHVIATIASGVIAALVGALHAPLIGIANLGACAPTKFGKHLTV